MRIGYKIGTHFFLMIQFFCFWNFFCIQSVPFMAAIPIKMPITAPANTSDGKCTNRYSREKAMIAAKRYAAIPTFRFQCQSTVAAAKDTMV